MGQWSVGVSADAIGWKPTLPGIGPTIAYALDARTAMTLDGFWYFPETHRSSGVNVGNPRVIATSDTSSYSWKRYARYDFSTVVIGIQRSLNRKQRVHEWFWKVALGYGRRQEHYISDKVGTYTGSAEHYDFQVRSPLLLVQLGGGSVWHLPHADFLAELADMGAIHSGGPQNSDRTTLSQKLTFAVSYRWHI